jgi:signal transduction histidine kinase
MRQEYVPLAPLLMEVAERARKSSSLLYSNSSQIDADVDRLGGIQVRGYRRWLIYMLEAVLQNANHALPRQGGMVTITGSKNQQWAEIRIRDNGNGVPETIRSKLFKNMIPRRQDRNGLGIGSLLAATIVEEHQGSIELEKPGPSDTTILIRLPIAKRVDRK